MNCLLRCSCFFSSLQSQECANKFWYNFYPHVSVWKIAIFVECVFCFKIRKKTVNVYIAIQSICRKYSTDMKTIGTFWKKKKTMEKYSKIGEKIHLKSDFNFVVLPSFSNGFVAISFASNNKWKKQSSTHRISFSSQIHKQLTSTQKWSKTAATKTLYQKCLIGEKIKNKMEKNVQLHSEMRSNKCNQIYKTRYTNGTKQKKKITIFTLRP